MIRHFDHVTVVVRDLAAARRFFGLLGFAEDKAVLISGPRFAQYMGVEGIEADHVTLVLAGATPRLEVQLLHYRHPQPLPEPAMDNLARVGFNHICFAVDDLEATVARLQEAGVELRNRVMEFHHRRLVFLRGPEGITVELAEWKGGEGP
jgi:catechol 2,3-dioxygenase-like lactoylglutathione lyase family enzyme